ncbi:MAG: hypothetical protein COV29_00775 [Candidatus Yanofskybacteria bacterium CG10_big_fil_rev_8_21_14_0_10_36_16]|uniref:Rhodanese domain-containing protein n=1 Tax=Candidatus Yanofskybacteria bacterium CG10_big_fil_rev_8_21_14_0_10_36_16 TaxID=1975096 RepID=A0A2J0Q817_9BACT|nr:MAG: hypothetical protein COV29_00775 [Candidatus Yanofskybacteria bacterium CG10_big_fil_rev_8_21_14_0_10_36_16]
MKKTLILIIILAVSVTAYFVYKNSNKQENEQRNSNGIVVLDENTINQINKEVGEGNAVLLDVRTPAELKEDGYAKNSTHFELAKLEEGKFPYIPTDMKVYIYCKSGARAGKAKTILEENGFTDVTNIGGLSDWEKAGGEVVK